MDEQVKRLTTHSDRDVARRAYLQGYVQGAADVIHRPSRDLSCEEAAKHFEAWWNREQSHKKT